MPVLPAVASSTRPPGFNSPRFSASRIIHLPARSFTDCPGFMNSALPRMVQPVASEARLSLISGVLPIASMTSLLIIITNQLAFPLGNFNDPKGPTGSAQGRVGSTRLCEDDLSHVDIAG